jgi:outer membrane protein OmpA-like peptidoglycan-associated protein
MKNIISILLSILLLSFLIPWVVLAAEGDAEGAKDHPLFNRMPGYLIQRYDEKQFDTHSFRDAKLNEINVEGKYYEIRYAIRPGVTEPSRIQVLRNYENAVEKIGGTVLKSNWDGNSYMKVTKDGKEIWAHVAAGIASEFSLFIIEKGAMAQDLVANAEAFSNDIKTTGHAAVYGIYFDTGQSVIKPESGPSLEEIAKLLKRDASLRLYVVGHTDNVGGIESNMKLSRDRANSVVQALVEKYGINAARLKAYGVGPLCPVTSNETEEGKAKNRRVELVKQ